MATKLAKVIADFRTSLATKISVAGTTATLQSATDDDSVALPAGKYFFTADGDNTQKEYFLCDLSGTALTNLVSISRQGVQTSGAAREHRVGATMVITNFAHIKYLNDLFDGTTNLNAAIPLGYDASASITTNYQLVTKEYADALTYAGAPNATPTAKGIQELATATEYIAGIATGATGAALSVTPDILLTYDTVHRNVGPQYGTTLAYGDVLYLDSGTGKYLKAVATNIALIDKVCAVAYDGGVLNDYGKTHFVGSIIFTGSGLTIGAPVYLSDTATVSSTPGTYRKVIGIAITATAWQFIPSVDSPIATPTASRIPIADSNGKLNSWVDALQYSFTAGENIDTTSAPLALYQKASDGKVYKLDATSAAEALYGFVGIAPKSQVVVTDGAINVQVDGVVANYSALTPGSFYYATNTPGVLSTTAGTTVWRIGRALSATTLRIDVEEKVANGTTTFTSTTTTVITTGFKPRAIRLHATMSNANVFSSQSSGGWTQNGGGSSVYGKWSEAGTVDVSSVGGAWYVESNNAATETHAGTISATSATGFTLSNTKTNSPGTVAIYWEAVG